jgi:hypothetical protein
VKHFSTLIGATNFVFKFDVNDTAVTDSFDYIPHNLKYLTRQEMDNQLESGAYVPERDKHVRLADPVFIDENYKAPGRNMDIFFSWLVEGCGMWYADRLTGGTKIPDVVLNAKAELLKDTDTVEHWLEDRCVTYTQQEFSQMSSSEQYVNTVNGDAAWTDFTVYCKAKTQLGGCVKKQFYESLRTKGFGVSDGKQERGHVGYIFQRIRIVNVVSVF